MRIRHPLLLLPVLLVACSAKSPLAGNWAQDTGSDAKGVNLTFDETGTKLFVHGAPAADGTHAHPPASFTFDATSNALTVTCKLLGDGKAETWKGTVAGAAMELTGGTDTLKFRKGGSAH
jgi:hypothetical protein